MRDYELMFVVDPRLTDEEIVALTDEYRQMIETDGGEVHKEESWGKRRLAYQINKLSEGSYVLFHVHSEDGSAFREVEQRLRQNEQVLRYLTVRTDAGRLRHRAAKDEAEVPAATGSAGKTDESVAKEAS